MSQWTQQSRAKSLIGRSSVVTHALMQNVAKFGLEPYQRLQGFESKAVAAGATYEVARAGFQGAQVKRDEAEKDLTTLNSACLLICKVRGVSAALFEQFDKGDPMGLATHLEGPVRRIAGIGPMLADMLRAQIDTLDKCVAGLQPATEATARAFEELSAALFELESGIASARALLAGKGVVVKFVKARPAKKAKAIEPGNDAPKSMPAAPRNGASSHVQPASEALGGGLTTN